MRLQLWSDSSLEDDADTARAFLQQLLPARPIRPLSVQVERETHHPEKPQWLSLIGKATETIARGDFEKVVLARATDLQCKQRVNPVALMAASRALNLNCYHFCMIFAASNAFLGSTPERLWRRRGKLLRTEALAGTVASHTDDKQAQRLGEWLLNDDKTSAKICWWWKISASVFNTIRRRWRCCLLRSSACAKCSTYAAVSGRSSSRPTMSCACTCYSRRRRLPGFRDSQRASLFSTLNPLTASGTPVRPGIYPRTKRILRGAALGARTGRRSAALRRSGHCQRL